MTASNVSRERRRTRSARLQIALGYQLRHVREVYGFDDVVLANEDGLIVASAGSISRAASLAAIAPALIDGSVGSDELQGFVPDIRLDRIAAIPVTIDHEPLYLCVTTQSTADTRKALVPAFERLSTGVERIFRTLSGRVELAEAVAL